MNKNTTETEGEKCTYASNHIYFVDYSSNAIFTVSEVLKKEGIGQINVYKAIMFSNGERIPCVFKSKTLSPIEMIDEGNIQPLENIKQNMTVLQDYKGKEYLEIESEDRIEREVAIEETKISKGLMRPKFIKKGECYAMSRGFVLRHQDIINECLKYTSDKATNPFEKLKLSQYVYERKVKIGYTATEYIIGYTLNELIFAKGGFPPEIARYVFKDLIRKLLKMHNSNIAHLNIKLDHILVNSEGELFFIGYGISRDTVKKIEISGGTPPYCSNEIYTQSYRSMLACDIFSMGVLLFAMTNCRFPFAEALQGQTLYATLMREEHQEFWITHKKYIEMKLKVDAEYDPELCDLINNLIAHDPEIRPSLSEVMLHPWLEKPIARKEEVKREIMQRASTYIEWLLKKNQADTLKKTSSEFSNSSKTN